MEAQNLLFTGDKMFFCGISDIGKKRNTNQDRFSTLEFDGVILCTVCDGMGGASGGNVASELALETYTNYVKDCFSESSDGKGKRRHTNVINILSEAVAAANTEVYMRAKTEPELEGMGTTLVSAFILDNTLYTVNVGDSRLYRISCGSISRISRDHSYVQYLIDIGKLTEEEASKSQMRNIITRCIGSEAHVNADIFTTELSENDYVLICSDGLTNYVPESQIINTVTGFSDGTMDTPFDDKKSGDKAISNRLSSLVNQANKAGGGDNITAVLIRC